MEAVVELVEDNIAEEQGAPSGAPVSAPVPAVTPAPEESPEYKRAFDKYEELFGEVQDMSEALTHDLAKFNACEHDQARVGALIAYVKKSQQYQEKLLTLIVMLNNVAAGQLPTGPADQ